MEAMVSISDSEQGAYSAVAVKHYPIVLCFFVGSGLAALVYEVVWFQILELVIGSTAVSLAVLLGSFMGGMCIGSLAFARIIPLSFHPLRVYAAMELGIGLSAILILYSLPSATLLYSSIDSPGSNGIVIRVLLCVTFLVVPTMLMGATLPCAGRWVENTRRGVSWLGILYTGNLAGAVLGCLLAGFYLLRLHDVATATFVAVAVNALCAILALLLAAFAPYHPRAATAPDDRVPLRLEAVAVYATIAISGFTALGAQVVWTRILSLLLGVSVYTFSIILAVFLLGLGIGSNVGSQLARVARNPLVMLGWCQFFLIIAMVWAVASIDGWLPYWPIDPLLSSNPFLTFQIDLARCLWAVLPAAGFWGASFPLALAAAAPQHRDSGRMVGIVYAANTVGAIIGAVMFSIILIPTVGTLWAQRILIVAAALACMVVLLARLRDRIGKAGWRSALTTAAGIFMVPLIAAALAYGLPPVPGPLYAFGRRIMVPDYEPKMLYVGEGMNASVAVSEDSDKLRYFHIAGKTEASAHPVDMRLQRMLGHLSVMLNANPQSVLVVGLGAGVTAGAYVTYPEIKRVVICEIEPLIPRMVSGYFSTENHDVVKDPRVEIIYDDARHMLLTSNEKFDIITSDPIHPWVKGAATLYTLQYFELAKRHLKPGGVFLQWVPLYETSTETVKSEMATFFSVFPDGIVWINDRDGGGDVVLFGQLDPRPIDIDEVVERFNRADNARAAKSLRDVGFVSAIDLLSSYAGYGPDLTEWLKGAAISTDGNLRLQYLAGLGLNVDAKDQIISELMKARRLLPTLFVGSPETSTALRNAILKDREGFAITPPIGGPLPIDGKQLIPADTSACAVAGVR
jgi:spermidine synthase